MIDADALQVPFIQAVDTLVDFHLVVPAQAVQLAHIRQLAQRAVRFRCIYTGRDGSGARSGNPDGRSRR